MTGGGELRLRHGALECRPGASLCGADLSDRQRLALLLQGAALLSHLELAGAGLREGWQSGRVTRDGRLVGLALSARSDLPRDNAGLPELASILFGGTATPAGRGHARGIARELLAQWDAPLLPLGADRAVRELLDRAAFLWQPRFAPAREALAAEHRAAGSSLWVAGPGWFRRRLTSRCFDLSELRERLRSTECARLWNEPPGTAGGSLDQARRLFRSGRYRAALSRLARLRSRPARILRLRCLVRLADLPAARRLLAGLENERLTSAQQLEVAAEAVRLFANRGEIERAADWERRAVGAAGATERSRAALLAAAAAWDRNDLAGMERRLERARPALEEPDLAWRWRQLAGLSALEAGDGAELVRQLSAALGARRRLSRPQAGGLWNELGIGRVLVGDLRGAERAFRHAVHLLAAADGPSRLTLATANLAEVRLRRGRLRRLRQVFDRSAAENRRAGNWRALAHDREMRVRYELARGRARSALMRAEEALSELSRRRMEWRREELHALAARALGWLGRRDEAGEHLRHASQRALTSFEPEERPALWLHAGDRRRAAEAARAGPLAALWGPIIDGEPPGRALFERLDALGSFRAGRFLYDLELAAPGVVPLGRIRRAAEGLESLGAVELAQELGSREAGAWGALHGYLRAPKPGAADIRRLLRAAGAPEAELIWESGEGDRQTLIAGAGGERELMVECGDGRLRLRLDRADQSAEAVLELAARDLERQLTRPRPAGGSASRIVGRSPALRAALERIDRLAAGDVPVLIHGETGTGKELVARRIHWLSGRRAGPLLAINCAALPENLLLAELFGHRRGAFTGADRQRPGLFEEADGGSVLLDEIGDLPLEAQGALLRVLQEGEVRRVGENRPRPVDVRVIAATHRDLTEMVGDGRFREDLFYRLGGVTVELPPLRERGEDVLALAEHFLARMRGRPRLSPAARRRLLEHRWPGNVRELDNKLRIAVALSDGGIIRTRHLDLPAAGEVDSPYHQRLQEVRVQLVRDALAASGGNQAAAARRLGITRQAFSYLVRTLELGPPRKRR